MESHANEVAAVSISRLYQDKQQVSAMVKTIQYGNRSKSNESKEKNESMKPAKLIATLPRSISEHLQRKFQSDYKQDLFSVERLQTEPYYILMTE